MGIKMQLNILFTVLLSLVTASDKKKSNRPHPLLATRLNNKTRLTNNESETDSTHTRKVDAGKGKSDKKLKATKKGVKSDTPPKESFNSGTKVVRKSQKQKKRGE